MKKALRWFLIAISPVLAIGVLARVTGAVALLRVPTSAMEPTFESGDHILFRKKRGLNEADREKVVYFMVSSVPYLHELMQRDERVIKRVAGLPGDTVSTDGKSILINGIPRATKENYLRNEHQLDLSSPVVIPVGYFYALGDNDGNSVDSRMYGLVPISGVRGITISQVEQAATNRPLPAARFR